jgi:PAS domain S-box-containing protein
VGASAGGLEAFTDLLKAIPSSEDLAYVLVQHLDPTHRSLLVELLAKSTPLNVREITDGMKVERNEIHIIPPNRELTIEDGVMRLAAREKAHGGTRTIDIFLRSLALDQGPNAIAVILSGAGSDGAEGLKAVKENGGATFAQLESSARYDSMPRAAIATGRVDFVLPAEKIAAEIMRAVHRPDGAEERAATNVRKRKGLIGRAGSRPFGDDGTDGVDWPAAPTDVNLRKIFFLLRSKTGVDFSLYRVNTVRRRLQRRLTVTKTHDLNDYVAHLRRYPAEVDALYRDLLIHVTSFFRNPAVFEMLKRRIFPKLAQLHVDSEPIRIWVAGCSMGQEAYSIAIDYAEFASAVGCIIPVQIFATDISAEALDYARAGRYAANEVESLTKARLKQYFTAEGDKFRVNKSIRDRIVFAQQNLLSQPPFTKVDLISCRNVMIYIETGMQQKLIPTFHYALRPSGYLLLGTSETVGQHGSLFKATEKPHKIYRKIATASWARLGRPSLLPLAQPLPAIPAAKSGGEMPGSSWAKSSPPKGRASRVDPSGPIPRKLADLRAAFVRNRERLALLQNAHDVSVEELQSSNEEVQSSNEELQSLNEELETSNEELESTNEELTTLNEELATRNDELRESERLLKEQAQLLELAPVLVRSPKDRVVYWNRGAEKMYGYTKEEALGQLSHLLLRAQFPEPLEQIQSKLARDGHWEGEVAHHRKDGALIFVAAQWAVHYDELGKVRAVLEVNIDISSRRQAEEALRSSEASAMAARSEVELLNEIGKTIAAELDGDRLTQAVTAAAIRLTRAEFGVFAPATDLTQPVRSDDVVTDPRYAQGGLSHGMPPVHRAVRSYLAVPVVSRTGDILGGLFFGHSQVGAFGERDERMVAGLAAQASVAMDNAHIFDQLERKVEERTARLRETIAELQAFSYTVSHDLRAPLRAMQSYAEALKEDFGEKLDQGAMTYLTRIELAGYRLDRLIQDVLTYSRISQGNGQLHSVSLAKLVREIVEQYPNLAAAQNAIHLEGELPRVLAEESPATQCLSNLLGNALKFIPKERTPQVRIRAEERGPMIRLWIEDNGIGIAPADQERIFKMFERVGDDVEYEGTGIGLAIVRKAMERMGGAVGVESKLGEGSKFWLDFRKQ